MISCSAKKIASFSISWGERANAILLLTPSPYLETVILIMKIVLTHMPISSDSTGWNLHSVV
jgi:hypothetical protein